MIISWLLIGISGVIYWWTTEYDYTLDEIPFTLIGSILGPITWIIGWTVHGKSSYILIKKRDK